MASNSFHQTPKAWAKIKHQLLGRYLSLFLGKLGGPAAKAYYVDAFAGPGILEDGTEGSAMIGAQCASNPIHRSRQGKLKCINIEADPETFEMLRKSTAAFEAAGTVENLPGKFEDRLPEVLSKIGSSPTLFFIDPFGTQGAEITTLQQLKQKGSVREAFVRYDDTRVKRLAKWALNNLESLSDGARKTAERFNSRASELTSASALQRWLNDEPMARENLIEGYINEVIRRGVFHHGISYPIRNPDTEGHRYFLVHFCDYADGYIYMANFMAMAERSWQERDADLFGESAQPEFLCIRDSFKEETAKKRVELAKSEVIQICLEQRWPKGARIQVRHVLTFLVKKLGWTVTRSECIRALTELSKEGPVVLEGKEDSSYCVFYLNPS